MITALLGPNGAGKSTYLRKLMGLDTGRIDLSISMVFQEPLLFDLSVFENVALGLRFRRGRKIRQQVDHWLEVFGVAHLRDRRAITLSGGEAQKVALARALVVGPKTLLLDEPFSNLDLTSQIEFRQMLKSIIHEKKIRTIWVTHNKAEALIVADQLMIMINRAIAQTGRPEEVIQKPATKEVAGFLGIENIFHGRLTDDNGQSIFKNPLVCFEAAAEQKSDAWVVVHPEDILLSLEPTKTSARNCLRGIVLSVEPAGLIYRTRIKAGETFVSNITRASAEEIGIAPGKELFLTFKATAVQVI
ncbi:MAG: ABC transporter ATP-binding protein [Candidatus Margulisbacteria bacterium]|nr:ABC transporter ATP-binding protein [Candidatus Margulisiibacteriota bacterium]